MELMQRYVDDDLNEQETSRMMSHVEECPDCAAMLERLRRLSDGLMQLPKVTPPFSLVDAILPQLELQAVGTVRGEDSGSASVTDAPTPLAETRSSRPRRGLFGRIAGVVALGLAIGAMLYNQPFPFGTSGSQNNSEAAMPKESSAQSFKMSDQIGAADDMVAPLTAGAPTPSAEEAPAPLVENGPAPSVGTKHKNEARQGIAETEADKKSFAPESAQPAAGQETDSAGGGQMKEAPSLKSLGSSPGDMGQSPDGKWMTIASADGLLTVIKAEDGSTVFATPVRYGMPTGLSWNADSTQLSYTFADENGKQTNYVYDVTTGKESTR
ncbi:anti-sigma factor family protein [Cohnella faecalis]|nr:zf-HC2 domain-containing protein [Cohnella faecalis]